MTGQNELILIATVFVVFGAALFAYKFFGRAGLYCVSAIATVLANIEVLVLIKAFGLSQTLGNVLFAVTFLVTDILSECEGKKYANKAVMIGIFTSLFFLVISQSWMLYVPAADDWAMTPIAEIFSNTPRMVLASLSVYAVSQLFDVWLYHQWWKLTEKKSGSKRKFLWLRNNGSTLISQLINTVLFTVIAFAGTYDVKAMLEIIGSSYVIYVFTSLLDTPAVYLARLISDKKQLKSQFCGLGENY
ncbi:MAG: queuosine precursor transporter [Bacteroides sp.]|nr:queuosine precursor transporter [Bacillota bacterium]MCM1394004.1 queuosine precursor transporter [[Eubacterium] siraeum]MCM1456146.1 queuosine precursor transporter [Bacteroides sp.]